MVQETCRPISNILLYQLFLKQLARPSMLCHTSQLHHLLMLPTTCSALVWLLGVKIHAKEIQVDPLSACKMANLSSLVLSVLVLDVLELSTLVSMLKSPST